jgi:peptidoglycan hydrolase CwlO-like protein
MAASALLRREAFHASARGIVCTDEDFSLNPAEKPQTALYNLISGLMDKVVVVDGKIDNLNDKVDGIKGDTSIIREKVTLIEGRTREGSPLDSFKGVVKKV